MCHSQRLAADRGNPAVRAAIAGRSTQLVPHYCGDSSPQLSLPHHVTVPHDRHYPTMVTAPPRLSLSHHGGGLPRPPLFVCVTAPPRLSPHSHAVATNGPPLIRGLYMVYTF